MRLNVCLCYLCDSTAESFGQLSNLSLCRLHLLPLLIQLLCLLVVIYLQVLNTKHTHARTHTNKSSIFITGNLMNSSVKVNTMHLSYQLHLHLNVGQNSH